MSTPSALSWWAGGQEHPVRVDDPDRSYRSIEHGGRQRDAVERAVRGCIEDLVVKGQGLQVVDGSVRLTGLVLAPQRTTQILRPAAGR